MKCKAYAKVNLSLNVVSRREDGYHELEMIMVPIDLFDVLEIETAKQMSITCTDQSLILDSTNTVLKAIELLREKYQFQDAFQIRIQKNIPSQAGLAGGSSDGATTLLMINELLQLNCSEEELYQLGKQIGADVPFCLYGKPALVKGIGEQLEPIIINIPLYLFLVKPEQGVSTKMAYENLSIKDADHPNYKLVQHALAEDNYQMFVDTIGNSLEESAFRSVPEIKQLKQELIDFGFDTALMSGSGSTVFAITQREELIDKAVIYFQERYPFVKKTTIVQDVKINKKGC